MKTGIFTSAFCIVLADPSPNVLMGLRMILRRLPGGKIAGEAHSFTELSVLVECTKPDILVADFSLLERKSGACPLGCLRASAPQMRVIAISARPELREKALKAGVNAFINKTDPPEALLEAIGGCASITALALLQFHLPAM